LSARRLGTRRGYIYSGSWAHCWLEGGANTGTRVQDALDTWVPDYDLVLIILNESGFGGCGGGGFQIVTLGSDWTIMAHEFGHGTGGLADEYCTSNVYAGGEPGQVDIIVTTDRATLKWARFVNPATPIPTGTGNCAGYNGGSPPANWSNNQDVGLFEGGGTYRSFIKCYAGDFNGDGKDDLLVHNDNSIMIYRSNGSRLDVIFSAVERVPGSWQFKPNDQFYIGDFNGDGKQDLYVFNGDN
jgi:hypothetical protein